MKKLIILAITLFLFSCRESSNVVQDIHVGDTVYMQSPDLKYVKFVRQYEIIAPTREGFIIKDIISDDYEYASFDYINSEKTFVKVSK